MTTRGKFITFEGGEGGGKSTQAKRLAVELAASGLEVDLTREPGGTPGAEAIRGLLVGGAVERWQPWSEALLHYAARLDHVRSRIEPALAAGRWVICDRFADSTAAYQGFGHQLGRESIARLHRLVLGEFKPDLTLILDLPVELGLRRASARGGGEDRYERMDRAFHERLRQGFLAIAATERERCAVIDASAEPDAVFAALRAQVRERLGR
ncbi:MAG: dTMP kinase [Alphaproteobacteria bacterium]|nr:dTMP kinase [Alphaproteobacteria bacterium]